jgi:hypothetical protein
MDIMDSMDAMDLTFNGRMDRDYVAPFQGFADGVIPDPGRCPGLVCRALSGLIPTSPIRLISCPCKVRVKSV